MATAGRNDLCPCGSGRKYKHCCLRAADADDAARTQLRTAEGVLVPALFSYAADEFGAKFFKEAWEEFFVWHDVPQNLDDCREFGTTFDPFFVFSFVPDSADPDLPDDWPTEPLALHFLHHEVESCPAFHRDFIEQACRSPASFFVVETTAPGRSVDLKDVLSGTRFHVLEQSASRTLQPGDLTYTRVVTAGGASIMLGAAPWIIPPAWHVHIIDLRDRLAARRLMTRGDLIDYDIEIRDQYHHIADALANPRLPQLRNTDGDPIEMTTLIYTLAASPSEAVDRLRPLATLGDEVHISDEAFDQAGTLTAAELSWIKAGNRKNKSWDNTILGNLRVDGSRLTVEVNSARRRDRIAKEIAKRFGSTATLIETKVMDVAKELESRRQHRSGRDAAALSQTDVERTPELQAQEAEYLRKHWEAWVDTRVPALGNRTPRQAAKTARGRERLEALLSDFERSAKQSRSAFVPDIVELKKSLGLK